MRDPLNVQQMIDAIPPNTTFRNNISAMQALQVCWGSTRPATREAHWPQRPHALPPPDRPTTAEGSFLSTTTIRSSPRRPPTGR